jgi:PAS domain S-box-containing protein
MSDNRPDCISGDTPIIDDELNEQARKDTPALGESDNSYRAIVKASPVAVTTIRDGRFLAVNPAACRLLGFSDPQEMVGMPVMSFVAPESQERVAKRIERLEDGKSNPLEEITLIRKDGTRITVESSSVAVPIDGVNTVVVFAQNISARKEKEEQLEIMKFTVDRAMDRIAWIAPDGRFLYANEAGYKEMDYTLEDLLSMRVSDIDPNYPPERWNEHFQELKKAGSMRLETDQKDGEGRTHYLDVSSNYIKFGKEEFICSYGRDVTELKHTEKTLSEQLEFERLIAGIAARLARTEPGQMGETIDWSLQGLGHCLRTERSFLARFSEDGDRLVFTNIWAEESINVSSSTFEIDIMTELPWVAQHIRNGQVINVGPGLTGLPDEAEKLRKWLEREGINSGLVVPICVEGTSIGLLGMDTVAQPREYPQSIVDRLRIVADMIGSMLKRVHTQTKLQ